MEIYLSQLLRTPNVEQRELQSTNSLSMYLFCYMVILLIIDYNLSPTVPQSSKEVETYTNISLW